MIANENIQDKALENFKAKLDLQTCDQHLYSRN
ncbi:hypothetical protein U210_00729 [Staphylococcus aureus W24216]|nr:hypothetical protein U210_00729 [Staphylococcus aureus W24216]